MASIRGEHKDRPAVGTATSLANVDAMSRCGVTFPDAHLDARKMADLAAFVSIEAGFDTITPVFSVVHEAAGLGAAIDWGARDVMPTIRQPLCREPEQIVVPDDFEERLPTKTVLEALRILKHEREDYAIVGKAFGPWSLSYRT